MSLLSPVPYAVLMRSLIRKSYHYVDEAYALANTQTFMSHFT